MRLLISGASGLVGSAARDAFADDHDIVPLVRSKDEDGVYWNPAGGKIDTAGLEAADVIIHLAGENIAGGRWTEKKKSAILDSRVQGTTLLCEALANAERKPSLLLAASAMGYYGDHGSDVVDEDSLPGDDFLANVCMAWEEATRPAANAGIRVINMRFGLILSGQGGPLKKMELPFKLGLGGVLGSGNQYMSWVSIHDVVGVMRFAMETPALEGPVNVVSPNPVTNRTFTKTLGRILGRPTILPAPAFALRLALGEMADELLLASIRVEPRKLLDKGYPFRRPTLEGALRQELGRGAAP